MKLNERMKRRLAVLGCVVVGAVLIAAIGSQFRGETQGSNQTEEQTKQTEAVTVAVMPAETTEVVTRNLPGQGQRSQQRLCRHRRTGRNRPCSQLQ